MTLQPRTLPGHAPSTPTPDGSTPASARLTVAPLTPLEKWESVIGDETGTDDHEPSGDVACSDALAVSRTTRAGAGVLVAVAGSLACVSGAIFVGPPWLAAGFPVFLLAGLITRRGRSADVQAD